ncbi:MAG: hypothetical protein LLG00_14850, partial [Planctomycetaceae bacterium]|nr:hypothetical protein [Planctomycetaceae bacterium]
DARAALDARDKTQWAVLMREFGNWVLFRAGGWWSWDVAYLATTAFGARQHNATNVSKWAEPLLDAFCGGAWLFVWTETTLFWARKPTVCVEGEGSRRRLHNETGPACANEIENLYFWHGVLVPAYAIVSPEFITLTEIEREQNEEVRRILIERFGWERYLVASKAQIVDQRINDRDSQTERLYRMGGGTQRFVCVDPSTGRRYALGVPREITTCESAQRWMSHGLDQFAIHRS